MLQQTREVKLISANLEKKIKAELQKLLESDRETYDKFYAAFGRQLKFGVVAEFGKKKELLQDLIQLKSRKENKLLTLKEYCANMPASQKHIYFVSGENGASLPQTTAMIDRGFDVLLLEEQVDEFIPQTLLSYEEHEFKNILTDDLELETEEEKKQAQETSEDWAKAIDFLKETFEGKIADVQMVSQLGDHAVSIVPDGGVSFEMEKYFLAMDPNSNFRCGRILQLNPNHSAVCKVRELIEEGSDLAAKYAELLYNQGLLIAGLNIEDPMAYSKLVCELMF